jgi:hypothetical protein
MDQWEGATKPRKSPFKILFHRTRSAINVPKHRAIGACRGVRGAAEALGGGHGGIGAPRRAAGAGVRHDAAGRELWETGEMQLPGRLAGP